MKTSTKVALLLVAVVVIVAAAADMASAVAAALVLVAAFLAYAFALARVARLALLSNVANLVAGMVVNTQCLYDYCNASSSTY